MTELNWTELTPSTTIPAQPHGLWTVVLPYVQGPVKIKIEADGAWEFLPSTSCGPDGYVIGGLVSESLVPTAPIGALVGKVGGGTAEKPDADKSTVFSVGRFCVLVLPDGTGGALFLTMNDKPDWFPQHSGGITVKLSEAR
jgi:hypothetical protein